MTVWRNISIFDLLKIQGYTAEQRDYFLRKLGCDTSRGVETLDCTHRTLSGEVVTGTLFICKELTTKEWLSSGYSSFEAQLLSKGDISLVTEVSNMSRGGND